MDGKGPADGIVPGCYSLALSDADKTISLFQKNAQLKHIWFVNCELHNFAKGEVISNLRLYQTLNRRVPTDLGQKIIDAVPLSPAELCEALGAVKNDSLPSL